MAFPHFPRGFSLFFCQGKSKVHGKENRLFCLPFPFPGSRPLTLAVAGPLSWSGTRSPSMSYTKSVTGTFKKGSMVLKENSTVMSFTLSPSESTSTSTSSEYLTASGTAIHWNPTTPETIGQVKLVGGGTGPGTFFAMTEDPKIKLIPTIRHNKMAFFISFPSLSWCDFLALS